MSHEHHPAPTMGDRLYETFFSAALGGAAIALLFLIIDSVTGEPLRTPSLAGRVLFFGADPNTVDVPDLTAVSLMTAGHIVGFLVMGFLSSILVRQIEERTGGSFFASLIGVFLLLEAPAFLVAGVALPELGAAIGHAEIIFGNLLAAWTMTVMLRRAHTTATSSD